MDGWMDNTSTHSHTHTHTYHPQLLCLSPSFPNKMVLGRTHIKEVAIKRKLELNNYVHNLLRSSTEVSQVHTHPQTHSHTHIHTCKHNGTC